MGLSSAIMKGAGLGFLKRGKNGVTQMGLVPFVP